MLLLGFIEWALASVIDMVVEEDDIMVDNLFRGKTVFWPSCEQVLSLILTGACLWQKNVFHTSKPTCVANGVYPFDKQMEYRSEQELVLESEGDPDGGWVDTHHFSDSAILEEKVADMALEDKVC